MGRHAIRPLPLCDPIWSDQRSLGSETSAQISLSCLLLLLHYTDWTERKNEIQRNRLLGEKSATENPENQTEKVRQPAQLPHWKSKIDQKCGMTFSIPKMLLLMVFSVETKFGSYHLFNILSSGFPGFLILSYRIYFAIFRYRNPELSFPNNKNWKLRLQSTA